MGEADGLVVFCKTQRCKNPVAKQGRICDSCYLKLPGGRKPCPRCKSTIHARQRECAKHMLEAKGGVTRRPREAISSATRKIVYQRDSYTCTLCGLVGQGSTDGEKIKGFEIDHIKRVRNGGDNDPNNLRLLCHSHNHFRG